MSKPYKAIFLDWDDTIGDFSRSAKCALTTMFEIHQLYQYTDYDTFVQKYSEHNTLLWEQYGRDEVTKEVLKIDRFLYPLMHACGMEETSETRVLARRMCEDFLRMTNHFFSIIPDADKMVKTLASRYPLTIVSNGFVESQYLKFRKSGLEPYFTHVVLSEEVGAQKPNPRIYEEALRINGITADEALMIGDSYTSDVEGARAAGIDQMWFRRVAEGDDDPNHGKLVTLTEGQTATYIVNSYRQITDILADGKWVA
jgi:putative hydrolase of the HAD superfamily